MAGCTHYTRNYLNREYDEGNAILTLVPTIKEPVTGHLTNSNISSTGYNKYPVLFMPTAS